MRKLRLRPLFVWMFLAGFAALFLLRDAGGSGLLGLGARIQMFPALLRWETTIFLFAGMTLLAGRFYCSLLCPLGLFQEAVHGLGKRRLPGYRRGTSLRYWILAATVASMAAGTLGVLHLLDPFANFGRGVTQILRPAIVAANNLLAALPLPEGMSRFIHTLPPAPLTTPAALAAGVFFASLAAWSVFRGRPYCDGLCPVGTFLGLFSPHSLLRIRFDPDSCSNCGRCEAACPTACLSARDRKVESDRCVLCLSCVEACPGGALRLTVLPTGEGLQRRNFLRAAWGLGAALGLASIRRYREPSSIPGTAEAAGPPISPPGSRSHENFSQKCIACSACVRACPAGIIRPALLAWGASGLFQPRLDYDFGYCQFECNSCTAVCPAGAIEPLSLEAKQRVQIGRAQFHRNACIVVKNGTACGACSEHCPTQAAHMVPYRDGLSIPAIDPSLCIGCGACHFACPAAPKAMTVRGLPTHGTAKSVTDPGDGPMLDPLEEFPF